MTNAAQHESPVVTALCSQKKPFALPSEHFFIFLEDFVQLTVCCFEVLQQNIKWAHIFSNTYK